MKLLDEMLRRLLFLPPAASSMAGAIDHLHYSVILVTFAGAALLVVAAAYFCLRYRRRRARATSESRPPAPTPPVWAEIGVVVFLFTLFVGWWAIGFRQYVELAQAPRGALDIYVTGKQWMWKFAYPDGAHTLDDLYVPAGRPVRLILTSRDVIHSFYVPAFRVKQDAVPGRYTSLWFTANLPGKSRIFCAEYCGTQHSRMGGFVVALAADDFAHWLTGARSRLERQGVSEAPEVADLSSEGERVAARYGCLRCHTVDGSPHIGPSFAGLYGADVALTDGKHVTADVAYLTESMMDPDAKVHAGFEPVMPSYAGYLKPPEVSALVEYIKGLRDAPGRTRASSAAEARAAGLSAPAAGAIGPALGEPRVLPAEPWHGSEPGLPGPGRVLMPLPRASRETLERLLLDAGATPAGAPAAGANSDGGAP
jgi:cytochrome c oxidase subunit 2